MAGTKIGGMKAAAKNLARDPDFYAKIGAKGGRNGRTGGFAANPSWISLGSFRLQPSEIARVAIALWGANTLAGHKPRFNSINAPFVKFLAVAGTMFTLILAERDLGMAMTFLLVVVALLFFAGINMRYIAGLGMFVAAGFTIVFLAG